MSNKDNTPRPAESKAGVPATNAQVPAVRSGVPITLDKHAAVTEATAELATLLGHFGGKKWNAFYERYENDAPTSEHIAAVQALLPSLPQVREQWAEVWHPISAYDLITELGMVAEGMPLANNINPKYFLQNLVDNLKKQKPPPMIWEVREARIAYVGTAHFGEVSGFMEMFAEKRKEGNYINKIQKPGFIEDRLKKGKRYAKDDNPLSRKRPFDTNDANRTRASSTSRLYRCLCGNQLAFPTIPASNANYGC